VLILDSNGVERWRLEGYLPPLEFRAWLEMGLARVAFMQKRWEVAEGKYAAIAENYPETNSASEALYWRAVSHYKLTNDHTVLGQIVKPLTEKYPNSVWALKTSPWAE
jgi:outer membrane protein assembly factor BamD (BamD/ComL family)